MTSILDIDDLSVDLPAANGVLRILDGVSLRIGRGEILGLVGPSGAGKSTLALAILKLLPPSAHQLRGRIRLEGTAVETLGEAEMRRLRGRRAALVAQDANAALDPLQRIDRQLGETIISHRAMPGGVARARAAAALAAAGVDEAERILNSYPHQLSGGMRQRVALALAVCTEPVLLVADEPVSNLDIASRAIILARLAQLARRDGLAILLITHDLAVVAEVADRIAVLDQGRIVESGETRRVLAQPRQPATRALCDCIAGRTQRQLLDAGDHDPRSLALVRRWLATGGVVRTAEPVLVVTGASKTYRQSVVIPLARRRPVAAVQDVSLSIRRGEIFGIVGESGSGKSTLGRLIAGLEAADSGRIIVDGRSISPRSLRRRRRGETWPIQMVFQDPAASLNPRLTAGEAIAEMIVRAAPRPDAGHTDDLTRALLACVGLPAAAAGKRPDAFSGGEKQRIVLARALAARPRLLVCDEPTSALDVINQGRILDLLGRLSAGLGLTVLFISHDLIAVRRVAQRVGVMRAGRLCEIATAAEMFATPRHPYTRELVSALRATDQVLATAMAAADDDRTPARRSALGLNTLVEPEGQRQ